MKPQKAALRIFDAALRAADPEKAVLQNVSVEDGTLLIGRKRYELSRYERIFVVGAGKASASMAKAIEKLLGKRIKSGLINVKYGHTAKLRRIELNECGHPVPDEAGEKGAERIEHIVRKAGAGDLLICLISGAGLPNDMLDPLSAFLTGFIRHGMSAFVQFNTAKLRRMSILDVD